MLWIVATARLYRVSRRATSLNDEVGDDGFRRPWRKNQTHLSKSRAFTLMAGTEGALDAAIK
jgi:hypothetical protein